MSPPSVAGLDPLKDLFEQILVRLDALEGKVGGSVPSGSLSGGSSHGKPASNKRMSVVHGEYVYVFNY